MKKILIASAVLLLIGCAAYNFSLDMKKDKDGNLSGEVTSTDKDGKTIGGSLETTEEGTSLGISAKDGGDEE